MRSRSSINGNGSPLVLRPVGRMGILVVAIGLVFVRTAFSQGLMPIHATGTLTALIGSAGPAATLRVGSGETYTTIASAISAAGDGDTIDIVDAVQTEAGVVVDKNLALQGQGATNTIVQAAATRGTAFAGVFSVASSKTVTFRQMTIRHGRALSGAGVYCDVGSNVTIQSCIVTQNDATVDGGGVTSNVGANLTLLNTAVTDNSAIGLAGGVLLNAVTQSEITRCLVNGNGSGSNGGGLYLIGSPAGVSSSIANSTISGNSSDLSGGGAYFTTTSALQSLSVTFNAVTVVGNHCDQDNSGVGDGGGLAVLLLAGSCTVKNSILANNYKGGGTSTASDASGAISSGNYNLIKTITGFTISGTTTNNIVGQDPNLSILGNYGGPTQSFLPLFGSPVIDAITNGTNGMGIAPLNVDQRGVTRPYNGAGDIGAVEASPYLITAAVAGITATSANAGGSIIADGGAAITARGVVWNTAGNPTTSDNKTSNGTGTGSFTSSLTGLSAGTTYFYRAYGVTSNGAYYGDQKPFTTSVGLPTVTVASATAITGTTASSGGTVTSNGGASVTSRGVVWNTTGNPTTSNSGTTNGSGTGSFTSSLTGLSPGTTYYVRAYATNSIGTAYSSQITFATSPTTPTVSVTSISSITSTTASSGGNVTSNGGALVTARGVVWNTASNPTTSDSKTIDGTGTGSFASSLTGLLPGKTYYVRAYATNSAGTDYSSQISFKTAATTPTVITPSISAITDTSASGDTDVASNGGASVTVRGVAWNTTGIPTTADAHTTDGTGTGSFISTLTGLSPNTTYYVRGYATNSVGTGYSTGTSFTTAASLPPVTTPTVTVSGVTSITATSASSGGNVTSNGGAAVTARGVAWNTIGTPTTNNNHTVNGTGTGTFGSSLTNLSPGTTYYVRAYATNSVGTSYSSEKSFTTATISPTVTAVTASSITATTASAGGNITGDGGAAITARGVCWNTTGSPTTSSQCTSDGDGAGSFTSSLTGLSPNTTYYFRAYATNSAGTAYSSQKTFTTAATTPTVATPSISSITDTSVSSDANIASDGGDSVTARGIVWNTTGSPTLSDSGTNDGTGTGDFTSSLTNLSPNTTYYVRAYAANSAGTVYSTETVFTTAESTPAATTPTVSEAGVSSITATSASSGGTVISDGEADITARGVCWNTTGSPTANDLCTSDGTGTGSFTSSLTDLAPNTTYDVRTYATNSAGTTYSSETSFTTPAALPTLAPLNVSAVTGTTADAEGDIFSNGGAFITARGVCWNTTASPSASDICTNDGTGMGSFTSSLASLSPNTTYYVRGYATNSAGTAYSTQSSFTTSTTTATVAAPSISSVTDTSAFSDANVPSDGGASVTARGVVWNTTGSPTLSDNFTSDGTGTGDFISSLTGLSANTTYYVRAYATNSAGTVYSVETSFTTAASPPSDTTPTVSEAGVSSITATTASSGGVVISDGGDPITARGVVWNTSGDPTLSDSYTMDGIGTGSFTSTLTDLSPNTTYYVRTYATNSTGTSYSSESSFTTPAALPTFSIVDVSTITQATADADAIIVSNGGAFITARGFCWNTTGDQTASDECSNDGTGMGSFTGNLVNLSPNTTYYVRAYATNSSGTVYSNEVTFVTDASSAPHTSPSLGIAVSARTAAVMVGDAIAFDIDVENVGDADAHQLVVTIPLPQNTDFVSAQLIDAPPAGRPKAATVNVVDGAARVTFDLLLAGEKTRIELILRAMASGSFSLTATVGHAGQSMAATGNADAAVTVQDRIVEIVETAPAVCGAGAGVSLFTAALFMSLLAWRRSRHSASRREGYDRREQLGNHEAE